jgi:hypothetical protein
VSRPLPKKRPRWTPQPNQEAAITSHKQLLPPCKSGLTKEPPDSRDLADPWALEVRYILVPEVPQEYTPSRLTASHEAQLAILWHEAHLVDPQELIHVVSTPLERL